MYCTLLDLERRVSSQTLIALTDDSSSGQIDEDVVNEAIADAVALIDAHLRERYTVPLVSVPELIVNVCSDLTIYHLHARRYTIDISDAMQMRYRTAVATLEKIASGRIHLPDIDPENGPDRPDSIRVIKTTDDREFGKDTLATW